MPDDFQVILNGRLLETINKEFLLQTGNLRNLINRNSFKVIINSN